MNKIKKIVPLLILTTTLLTGCDDKEVIEKFSIVEMSSLLEGSLYKNEISNSSKATFEETYKKDDVSISTNSEEWNIYSNNTAGISGTNSVTYSQSNTTISDSYDKIVKRVDYSDTSLMFFVTDYLDGNKRQDWKDSGTFLPIVKSGSSDYDGTSYLLESSVEGQLSKQVSLIASQFIQAQFTSNVNLQSSAPQGYKSTLGKKVTYYIDPFSYNYEEDSIRTDITVSFNFVVENNKLLSFTSNYEQKETMSGDNESYVISDVNTYELSYDARSSSPSNLINPEDYFLTEVKEIEAYYYDGSSKEVVVSLDKLPSNTYIHFRAKDYTPAKSIDLEMYPNENPSSDENVIKLDGSTFHSEKSGTAKVSLMTITGYTYEVDVTVLPPELKEIRYSDTYSGIETNTTISGDETIVTRYVYSNTTYGKINISLSPSDAELDDIEVSVDKENMVNITKVINEKTITYTYEVLDVKDGDSFTVTFASKAFPDVKKSITYLCKSKLTPEESLAYLVAHKYSFTSIYGNMSATMSFAGDGTGLIEYKSGEQTYTTEFNFTLDLDNLKIKMEITSSSPLYDYDEIDIKLDLSQIDCWEGTDYHHTFYVVK